MNLLTSCTYLLLLSILLVGCSQDNSPAPKTGVDVTFLKEGASYTFYYDDEFLYQDTLKVTIEKELAPDTFLIRNYSETIAAAPTQYWVLKDNKLFASVRLRDPSAYWMECQFGVPVGTSWNVVKNGVHYTYTIDGLDVPVSTKDEVITDAIRIRIVSGSESAFQYVSPTVGLLGNGSFQDEDVLARLIYYSPGTGSGATPGHIPPITFGNFPFLTVGKYWNYVDTDPIGSEEVTLLIESKLPSQNIYKVKLTIGSVPTYQYWYEDNGMLMVYDEGEDVLNADPIYRDESNASIGDGWAGISSSGTFLIYKITDLDVEVTDSFFGDLQCMEIEAVTGPFSIQDNYWHPEKGSVLTIGTFTTREVVSSNARRKHPVPFIVAL